jgi:hypothetical protein
MKNVALLGAGGKIGGRVIGKLAASGFALRPVEPSAEGRARLDDQGFQAMELPQALEGAEAVVLALPDRLIGPVVAEMQPLLRPGTMLVILDAAAPYSDHLPKDRPDLTYFITHPCHPPLWSDSDDPAERADSFGLVAPQSIVCALMQGPEEHYAAGEAIARAMWGPILRCHRVEAEHIAILEPGLSEMVALPLCVAMGQAIDRCAELGVPREAAYDFMVGHLNVMLAVVMGRLPNIFSDGAKMMIDFATPLMLQESWRETLEPRRLKQAVELITEGRARTT